MASGKKKTKRKLLLLDGHSLAYRAFFALPDSLVTSSGQITNAVYGFTSMLIKLLGDERPAGVAVCFDLPKPTFRDAKYSEYKAGRSETPDTFREQLPLIREVLDALQVPQIQLEGFEADDVLATLAKRAQEDGDEVVVVTGDRDCLQLVRDGVTVLMTRRGITDMTRYDADAVHERYGVRPDQWTDFAALKGEKSDNLPGVPGVGDKTAAKMVNEYGDIEAVIAAADEQRPKIAAALAECADQVRLNKELGYLVDDAPVDADPSQIAIAPWDAKRVEELFSSLEFKSLLERLNELDFVGAAKVETPSLELTSTGPLEDVPTTPAAVALDANAQWMAVCTEAGAAQVGKAEETITRLADWLADPDAPKVVHDAKQLVRLAMGYGVEVAGITADTMVAAYLLEPGQAAGYALPAVAERFLGVSLDMGAERKTGKQATLDLDDDAGESAALGAVATWALVPVLEERLANRGMDELARDLEYPLVQVLARMEHAGVLIDRDYLEELNGELGATMKRLEEQIHGHAGEEFNVNSNPQLQVVLFEKLDLPRTKKIKTGHSTDHAELEKIRDTHPIVEDLLNYREVAKLKTGFTDALLPLIDAGTGRIHTTFMQAAAATGRLASTNPNIQNIPIRGDLGRQIRRAFIAPDGHQLVSADYSQIELRVLAHLSGDEGFLEAFASGHDFHNAIAAKVYGVEPDDVQNQMRAFAKQFSFGIAYGMSAFGVSERLGIDREEAEAFIETYYEQFPKLKGFLDAQVDQARKDGYTTTMFGRRRYLPELSAQNYRVRAMGERMALNAPIQGSAADIMKRAMIDVDDAFRASPDLGRMLLTVHDELVLEVPDTKLDEATDAIRSQMEGAADLHCGLDVDVHTGQNWSDAHA